MHQQNNVQGSSIYRIGLCRSCVLPCCWRTSRKPSSPCSSSAEPKLFPWWHLILVDQRISIKRYSFGWGANRGPQGTNRGPQAAGNTGCSVFVSLTTSMSMLPTLPRCRLIQSLWALSLSWLWAFLFKMRVWGLSVASESVGSSQWLLAPLLSHIPARRAMPEC